MYKHTRKRSAFSGAIHSLRWANTLLPCSLLCQEELSSFCPAAATLWGVNSSYLGKTFGVMYPRMGAGRRACSAAQRASGEARFLRDATLKLTLLLHRRWILRAASRLGLRPNSPTVHTRDWVEGEPASVFREKRLEWALCIYLPHRQVPACCACPICSCGDGTWLTGTQNTPGSASVITCHGGSWDYSSAAAQGSSSFNPLPGLVRSGARFCGRVVSGNAFAPFVVHSSLLSQVPTNCPLLLGPLRFSGGGPGWDAALCLVPLYRAVARHMCDAVREGQYALCIQKITGQTWYKVFRWPSRKVSCIEWSIEA